MNALLPQAFWFRLAIPCRRDDLRPLPQGRLVDLPDACRLPDLARLEGRSAWADVRIAWEPKGLAIVVEVQSPSGKSSRIADGLNGFEVWIDTRDTRDVHRATRFCHHFAAYLARRGKDALNVTLVQRPIHRALADPPAARPGTISAHAARLPRGWRLELRIAADALHGYDPENNRRLGIAYQVVDAGLGDQFLGVGREFPVAEDPSLWATLELCDDP